MGPWLRVARGLLSAVLPAGAIIWFAVEPLEGLPIEGIGNLGLVAALAVLIGRYTFRQLENYRTDLGGARQRIDELEADLHAQGKAKAAVENRNRELEAYGHRLRLFCLAAGIPPEEIPQVPQA